MRIQSTTINDGPSSFPGIIKTQTILFIKNARLCTLCENLTVITLSYSCINNQPPLYNGSFASTPHRLFERTKKRNMKLFKFFTVAGFAAAQSSPCTMITATCDHEGFHVVLSDTCRSTDYSGVTVNEIYASGWTQNSTLPGTCFLLKIKDFSTIFKSMGPLVKPHQCAAFRSIPATQPSILWIFPSLSAALTTPIPHPPIWSTGIPSKRTSTTPTC